MCTSELTTNTITDDSKIGSHNTCSPVITASCKTQTFSIPHALNLARLCRATYAIPDALVKQASMNPHLERGRLAPCGGGVPLPRSADPAPAVSALREKSSIATQDEAQKCAGRACPEPSEGMPALHRAPNSPPAHPGWKLSRWMVVDAYFHRLVGPHFEPHFIAGELDMPDFDGRVGGEQRPALAFHFETLRRLGNVIERSGDVVLRDAGRGDRVEVSEAEAVPGVGVDQLLDGHKRQQRSPGVMRIAGPHPCNGVEVLVAFPFFT